MSVLDAIVKMGPCSVLLLKASLPKIAVSELESAIAALVQSGKVMQASSNPTRYKVNPRYLATKLKEEQQTRDEHQLRDKVKEQQRARDTAAAKFAQENLDRVEEAVLKIRPTKNQHIFISVGRIAAELELTPQVVSQALELSCRLGGLVYAVKNDKGKQHWAVWRSTLILDRQSQLSPVTDEMLERVADKVIGEVLKVAVPQATVPVLKISKKLNVSARIVHQVLLRYLLNRGVVAIAHQDIDLNGAERTRWVFLKNTLRDAVDRGPRWIEARTLCAQYLVRTKLVNASPFDVQEDDDMPYRKQLIRDAQEHVWLNPGVLSAGRECDMWKLALKRCQDFFDNRPELRSALAANLQEEDDMPFRKRLIRKAQWSLQG